MNTIYVIKISILDGCNYIKNIWVCICFLLCFENLHSPGIEPGVLAWKARVLPLHQECLELSEDGIGWIRGS